MFTSICTYSDDLRDTLQVEIFNGRALNRLLTVCMHTVTNPARLFFSPGALQSSRSPVGMMQDQCILNHEFRDRMFMFPARGTSHPFAGAQGTAESQEGCSRPCCFGSGAGSCACGGGATSARRHGTRTACSGGTRRIRVTRCGRRSQRSLRGRGAAACSEVRGTADSGCVCGLEAGAPSSTHGEAARLSEMAPFA